MPSARARWMASTWARMSGPRITPFSSAMPASVTYMGSSYRLQASRIKRTNPSG